MKNRQIITYKNDGIQMLEYVKATDGTGWKINDDLSAASFVYKWTSINTSPFIVNKSNYLVNGYYSSIKYYFKDFKNANTTLEVEDQQLANTTPHLSRSG